MCVEKYRVKGQREEFTCDNCGCPVFSGDYAFMDDSMHAFCSRTCLAEAAEMALSSAKDDFRHEGEYSARQCELMELESRAESARISERCELEVAAVPDAEVKATTTATAPAEVEWCESSCRCPKHLTGMKKRYTFGSTATAETDVYVFRGCACAVSVKHDPVGTYPSVVARHDSYHEAAGVGRLHAAMAASKYR